MLGKIWLNTLINFKFFRRNHMLLGIVSIFLFYVLLLMIQNFSRDSLSLFVTQMVFVNYIISCVMAVMLISEHLKSRCIKMVLTKPCPPEAWVGAIFMSIIIISATITIATIIYTVIYFSIGKIEFRSEFICFIIYMFFSSLVAVSFLATLAFLFSPVISVMIAIFFNPAWISGFYSMMATSILHGTGNLFEIILTPLFFLIYIASPIYGGFIDPSKFLSKTNLIAGSDWVVLGLYAIYAILFSILMFLISVFILRKRTLS